MPQMGKTWSTLNGQPLHDYLEEEEFNALMLVAEEADKDGPSKFRGDDDAERAYRKGMQEAICIFLDARDVPGVGDTLRTTWSLP